VMWEEFIREQPEDFHERFEALRKWIIEQRLLGMGGFEYQSRWKEYIEQEFKLTFTLRGWGEFMAAVVNDALGKDVYDYICFAFTSVLR